jgi:hypothetical protein
MQDSKDKLNKWNPKLRASEVSRLKLRVRKDGQTELVETHTVGIVIVTNTYQNYICLTRLGV